MLVKIQNCNNIEQGEVSITEGALNIKYAINGTGKTTIAKAISTAVKHDDTKLTELTPFQYLSAADTHKPSVTGIEGLSSVMTFDENYVNTFVYKQYELIENSFEIFIKTPDYEAHLREIETLLGEINTAFQSNPELDSLIQSFSQFIEGFGKAKSGYSAAGALGKGLAKGNKISNIPAGLEIYSPYLQNTENSTNVKWIKWQLGGKTYLDIADQCPYCSASIEETKDTILRVSTEFDANAIDQLNKMLDVFETLSPYFDVETAKKVKEIAENVDGITDAQRNYLLEIKEQVVNIFEQLSGLKRIGFQSLKNADKIADELKKYVIDLSYYTHLNSDMSQQKVKIINSSLAAVMEKAGILQGEIAKQNKLIQKTIEQHSSAINDFLRCAGYQYSVSIKESTDKTYHMILEHNGSNEAVTAANHLSYGERNALALVLFMYRALKDNPDLIVLDDPISSFDGNKKFAIIHMLFQAKTSLKNRTVLLLSHEFNTLIDVIYTMPYNFNPAPNASFLSIKSGILTEQPVQKADIQSFGQIAQTNISDNIDSLNKMVYLRRLFEIENPDSLAWQLLSNIFKKRKVPQYHYKDSTPNRDMTPEEIAEATKIIQKYIPDFDYSVEYEKTQDNKALTDLYTSSRSNYEKLQLYRIIFNENSGNAVVKKFVNETFHIENDYIFQLNPRKYDTIPQYIIDECDKDITA